MDWTVTHRAPRKGTLLEPSIDSRGHEHTPGGLRRFLPDHRSTQVVVSRGPNKGSAGPDAVKTSVRRQTLDSSSRTECSDQRQAYVRR